MKYLLLFFFCGLIGCSVAQSNLIKVNQPVSSEAKFPENWTGVYGGNLDIYTAAGLQQSIPMKLEITPIDSSDRWVWAITYGQDSLADRRSYELIVVDSKMGHYQIDEKNSIMLDAFLRGDLFISRFAVMGNLLDCTYEKIKDEIVFTILMGKETTIDTGGGIVAGDTIPTVQTYPFGILQRGRLRRIID